MKIGFLHLGDKTHGVTRYGVHTANAIRSLERSGVLVLDADAASASERDLRAAAAALRGADIVHIQFNNNLGGGIWGRPWRLRPLRTFLEAVEAPVVATVHDLRDQLSAAGSSRRGLVGLAMRWARSSLTALGLERRGFRLLVGRTAGQVVCSRAEAERLEERGGQPQAIHVVPHFVESRRVEPRRVEPAESPGDETLFREQPDEAAESEKGRRRVTLVGFIHERKGHDIAVDMLPLLPADVELVFAGSASGGWRAFADQLRQRAAAAGVADRLRITGYLSDPELDRVLSRTELAICPFRDVAASGSLSTLIGAQRRVLATDLPLTREYHERAPLAIGLVPDLEPETWAAAVQDALAKPLDAEGLGQLRAVGEDLSLERTAERHLRVYERILASP